jgi:hypothetical protein
VFATDAPSMAETNAPSVPASSAPSVPESAEPRPAAEAPGQHVTRSATAPVSAAAANATLMFAISPWGEVYVDGKSMGVSPPLATLQLEAGKHRLEIRNQAFAPYRDTVNLMPGQSLKIRHKFK